MAGQLQEFEVLAPDLVVDPATGNATIIAVTKKGVIRLSLAGEVLLLLRDRIAKKLAEARHGGLYMLPAVADCRGVGTSISRSQLQIRLVLEDGSEARLPIQETALRRLNKILTEWFEDAP